MTSILQPGTQAPETGTPKPSSTPAASDLLIETGIRGFSRLSPRAIDHMRRRLRAQTVDCVMETFGISFPTWVKVRNGQPIRHSVAERLVRQIGCDP